jgi:hypothetical protein
VAAGTTCIYPLLVHVSVLPAALNTVQHDPLQALQSKILCLHLHLQVYSNPQQAAAKGQAARQHILRHFTPDGLASKVMAEILRIQDRLGLNRWARKTKHCDWLDV